MGDAKVNLVTRTLAQLADRRTLATTVAVLLAGGPLAHGDAAAQRARCFRDGRRCGPEAAIRAARANGAAATSPASRRWS